MTRPREPTTLATWPLGRPARIVEVRGGDPLALRLLELGLTEGAEATVVKVAPLGDPLELRIRGYHLSIRREDARRIVVEPAPARSAPPRDEPLPPCPQPAPGPAPSAGAAPRRVIVAGNPNVGKTSLFNQLTGARYAVGNYAGITVEVRQGRLAGRWGVAAPLELFDCPGIYGITPHAEDERVALELLAEARALAERSDGPAPGILIVIDATNLARNLHLALQLLELGLPCVVALNLSDEAERAGLRIDRDGLAARLGCPVVPTDARRGAGVGELAARLGELATRAEPRWFPVEPGSPAPTRVLARLGGDGGPARWALAAELGARAGQSGAARDPRLAELDDPTLIDALSALARARYRVIDRIVAQVAEPGGSAPADPRAGSARVDRWLTHPIAGPLAFLAVMATLFNLLFWAAEPFMQAIEGAIDGLARVVANGLGPGPLTALLTEGVVRGVGNVLVFVPQIAILFAFLALLEDSGYLARAAFIIDRLMARVGLHGRAFVPLLSGMACAVPAILGTRTIASVRDRIVTILMIPYMSCSARLVVYGVIIGALFDANRPVLGPLNLGGLLLLATYLVSTTSALAVGALLKRTVLTGPTPPLLLELPPYRWPKPGAALRVVGDKVADFLREAGTIILACTVILWALLSFPSVEPDQLGPDEQAIERSLGGRFGKALEPVWAPIGQDWRIGIGILGSFAAREVFVSTLGVVYGIEGDDEDEVTGRLRERIREDVDPATGQRRHTPLSGLALMAFYLYAAQCMSTLAVIWRETKRWRWAAFAFASMTGLAYLAALAVFQLGRALGFG